MDEAEALMQQIEKEAAGGGTLPPVVVPAPVPQVAAMDMLKPPLLQRMVEAGQLGKKSGKGFYVY